MTISLLDEPALALYEPARQIYRTISLSVKKDFFQGTKPNFRAKNTKNFSPAVIVVLQHLCLITVLQSLDPLKDALACTWIQFFW